MAQIIIVDYMSHCFKSRVAVYLYRIKFKLMEIIQSNGIQSVEGGLVYANLMELICAFVPEVS